MRSAFDPASGTAFLILRATLVPFLVAVAVPVAAGDGEGGDFGDAPEGALAYPTSGVMGAFPTCVLVGPAGFILHASLGLSYFGAFVDVEGDGNAGACPPGPYDMDECAGVPGADAGIVVPAALTLGPGGSGPVVCPGGPAAPSWTGCLVAQWGADVDILVTNLSADDRFVNVLVDWDADGEWTSLVQTCPGGTVVPEHVLRDWVVPSGYSGPLSALLPPDFTVGAPPDGLCWARFSLTDAAVGPLPWDGSGHFGDGETEDYLFRVAAPPVGVPPRGEEVSPGAEGLRIGAVQPNPARGGEEVRVLFATDRSGAVRVAVHDAAGRRVALLTDAALGAGEHVAAWNGRDGAGRPAPPGVYFVRIGRADESAAAKLVLVR